MRYYMSNQPAAAILKYKTKLMYSKEIVINTTYQ